MHKVFLYLFSRYWQFCCLLKTFTSSLELDQARQSCSILFDTLMVFLTEFFEKVEKKSAACRVKQLSSGAIDLNLGLSLYLHPYFFVNYKDPGKSAHLLTCSLHAYKIITKIAILEPAELNHQVPHSMTKLLPSSRTNFLTYNTKHIL